MTPWPNPASTIQVRVAAVIGVIALLVLTVWTVGTLTSHGPTPSGSPGIGLVSGSPGRSSSPGPGDSRSPGTSADTLPSGGSSPLASETPTPGTTPTPTAHPTPVPTPRPTPAPTPRPVTAIHLAAAASGFGNAIFVTGAHDGRNRLFVVLQTGQVKVIDRGATHLFLDIGGLIQYGGEQGLLGLAFSPGFRTNGFFYVYYNQAGGGNIMVARYTAAGGTNTANAASAHLMIAPIGHPTYQNHNGGMLAFGPDGLLYFGTGDGGSGGNPTNTAQNLNSFLGKILRINVNAVGVATPFKWAYGVRNPWRWSFDSATGDIWIGDVGQNRYEEIDHVSRVAVVSSRQVNFGWRLWEGRSCYNPATGCSARGVTMPVAVYAHGAGDSVGCAVVGGYVYRGPVAALRGNYFYGDFCSGRIWRLVAKPGNQIPVQVAVTASNITSFGTDDAGNEYVVTTSGTIYRIGL